MSRARAPMQALPRPDLRLHNALSFIINNQCLAWPCQTLYARRKTFGQVVLTQCINSPEIITRRDPVNDPNAALCQNLRINGGWLLAGDKE
jgi:hypothetical protein